MSYPIFKHCMYTVIAIMTIQSSCLFTEGLPSFGMFWFYNGLPASVQRSWNELPSVVICIGNNSTPLFVSGFKKTEITMWNLMESKNNYKYENYGVDKVQPKFKLRYVKLVLPYGRRTCALSCAFCFSIIKNSWSSWSPSFAEPEPVSSEENDMLCINKYC